MPSSLSFWQDNVTLLRQLHSVLEGLAQAQYTYQSAATLGGSVGAHLRHVLEFYQTFLCGYAEGIINYDNRAREHSLETCLKTALGRLQIILVHLESDTHDETQLHLPVRVLENATDEPDHWTHSTVGRELTFLLSHTVHHQALIALILRHLGLSLPESFGIAPSTLRYRASQSPALVPCAP
jgi:uncharacterized damage-inducible protein DinB